jgi:Phosphotransferase enzyme family
MARLAARRPRRLRRHVLHERGAQLTGGAQRITPDRLDVEVAGDAHADRGDRVDNSPARLSDARLVSAGHLIRRFHDATTGTALAEPHEIVAHGDLGPHNIVFDADTASAIIDWDDDVGPGSRLVDFAHAVWCCADVCEPDIPVADQARKVRLICDAYRWDDPPSLIDEIGDRFRRARDDHAAHQRPKAVAVFDEMIAWMQRHGPALKVML